MHGEDIVLREAVAFGERFGGERDRLVAVRPHPRHPTVLPADDDGVVISGDRVDHIVAQGRDGADVAIAQPIQAAAGRGEPHAIRGVAEHRSDAAGHDRIDARVRREGAVAPPFDAVGVADPEIAFAILEQRRDCRR
jgi:hypothetical protein